MIVEVLRKHYARVEVSNINTAADIQKLTDKQPDLVFLGVKNLPDNSFGKLETDKIWISESLDFSGINYTGSRRAAIELDQNKHSAKKVIADAGLSTADFFTAIPDEYSKAADLPIDFPLFIKPPKEGGGSGIDSNSIVRDFSAYKKKVQSISDEFSSFALVERYLTGREFSVAILAGSKPDELLAMPVEIIAHQNAIGDRILSQKIKADDVELVIGVTDARLKIILSEFAKDAFIALGARDYGRIDIRMDEKGNAHFLEANLIPGLAQHDFISYFTSACQINESISYESMVLAIVEIGLARTESAEVLPKAGLELLAQKLLGLPA